MAVFEKQVKPLIELIAVLPEADFGGSVADVAYYTRTKKEVVRI